MGYSVGVGQTENVEMSEADKQSGHYYVSVIDGPTQKALASGPYKTHQDALDAVDTCRDIARKHDPRAHFAAWGTARISASIEHEPPQGVLQRWGYPLVMGTNDADELVMEYGGF